MTLIALTTADKVEVGTLTIAQHTGIASSDITAGAPCYIVAATGKFAHADGNGASPLNRVEGIATRTVAAGEALTIIRTGYMDGWVLTGDYGAPVYLSDTVGRLDTAAGSTPIQVGTIVAANGTTLGTAADKVLFVHCGAEAAGAASGAAIGGLTTLTDSTGFSGTHNDTLAASAAPVDLTDSTGLSGTHDDTLAATAVPAALTGGESPTEAEHNAVLTLLGVMVQNQSDVAQKVKELVALVTILAQNDSDTAQKVIEIIGAAA